MADVAKAVDAGRGDVYLSSLMLILLLLEPLDNYLTRSCAIKAGEPEAGHSLFPPTVPKHITPTLPFQPAGPGF